MKKGLIKRPKKRPRKSSKQADTKLKSILFIFSLFIMVQIAMLIGGYFLMQNVPKGNITQIDKFPAGKDQPTVKQQLKIQSKILKFSDYDELSSFMEEKGQSGVYGGSMVRTLSYQSATDGAMMAKKVSAPMMEASGEGFAVSDMSDAGGGSDDVDFSKTNVQVEGVDEADIVKTDGEYIYAVSKNDLFIVRAYPADEAEILAKIAFASTPQNIFINDDYLVVFGRDDKIYKEPFYKNLIRRSSYTFFKVFDIKDRKNPKQIRDLNFEGNYTNSRMIGEYIYFVTSTYGFYINDPMPIPRILENGNVIPMDSSEKVYNKPDVYYFDMPYLSPNMVAVNAINLKAPESKINTEVYLLDSSQNMYVSMENMYITYTKYISERQLELEVMREIIFPILPSKSQQKIIKIEAIESAILSSDEKFNKISQIIESFVYTLGEDKAIEIADKVEKSMKEKYADISKELEKTIIHKIAINKGTLKYKTFGEVTGHVLNQFSMDENNGYFRIATTKGTTYSRFEDGTRESYNNLYVLDKNLKQSGAVENLAEGERIYSVRFMQNRAYMVTFKQTDPLFVIDLTNPNNPTVLGKLKIPGYSSYLHPYDNTTLIGLGKATEETEFGGVKTKGIKLSLFDVSDVANPTEIDNIELGDAGSDSVALTDHKAFLFSKEKNLITIPVTIREKEDDRWTRVNFRGAAVIEVTKEGFKLRGKIDHSDKGMFEGESEYWYGNQYYDTTVKRALYIEDTLYTLSNRYIKANNLDTLDEQKSLELIKEKKEDFEIIN